MRKEGVSVDPSAPEVHKRNVSGVLWNGNKDLARITLAHPFIQGIRDSTLPESAYNKFIMQDTYFEGVVGPYRKAIAAQAEGSNLSPSDALKILLTQRQLVSATTDIQPTETTERYLDFLVSNADKSPALQAASLFPCSKLYDYLAEHLSSTQHSDRYKDWTTSHAPPRYESNITRLSSLINTSEEADLDDVRRVTREGMLHEFSLFSSMLDTEEPVRYGTAVIVVNKQEKILTFEETTAKDGVAGRIAGQRSVPCKTPKVVVTAQDLAVLNGASKRPLLEAQEDTIHAAMGEVVDDQTLDGVSPDSFRVIHRTTASVLPGSLSEIVVVEFTKDELADTFRPQDTEARDIRWMSPAEFLVANARPIAAAVVSHALANDLLTPAPSGANAFPLFPEGFSMQTLYERRANFPDADKV